MEIYCFNYRMNSFVLRALNKFGGNFLTTLLNKIKHHHRELLNILKNIEYNSFCRYFFSLLNCAIFNSSSIFPRQNNLPAINVPPHEWNANYAFNDSQETFPPVPNKARTKLRAPLGATVPLRNATAKKEKKNIQNGSQRYKIPDNKRVQFVEDSPVFSPASILVAGPPTSSCLLFLHFPRYHHPPSTSPFHLGSAIKQRPFLLFSMHPDNGAYTNKKFKGKKNFQVLNHSFWLGQEIPEK